MIILGLFVLIDNFNFIETLPIFLVMTVLYLIIGIPSYMDDIEDEKNYNLAKKNGKIKEYLDYRYYQLTGRLH